MSNDIENNIPFEGQFLIYQAEDGRMKLDVRLENETVWLSQQHMADLFQTTQQNISLHIRTIYEEGELDGPTTHKKFLLVRQKGGHSGPPLLANILANIRITYNALGK